MKAVGLDIGTTSLCGICCDTQTGEIVQSVTIANDSFLPAEHPWEKVQDSGVLLQKIRMLADQLLSQHSDVVSIGITGQMHGIVYLNAKGEPVSDLTIWQDGRGDQPYRDGETYASFLSKKTGYALATGYGAVTHFYNTVNHLVPADAAAFCTIHDLAAMALTNSTAPLLHPSDAASFGLFDLQKNCFDTEAIAACGMDVLLFPEVEAGFAVLGKTPEGIPVSIAIGDNQASVIGSVSDMENSILVNFGTGSQISCIVPSFLQSGDKDLRPLTDGRFLLVGSALCGGRAYAVLEKFLRDTAAAISGQPVASAYPAMDRLMADFTPPEEPLDVSTRFSGTRRDPFVRGYIRNIGIGNLTMGNLCYGVMTGMVTDLYDMYSEMRPMLQKLPTKMVGSGNGVRHNAPLAKLISEIFGMPLSIPAHKEEAAFGSALFGMVAAGIYPDLSAAQSIIGYL